MLADREQFHVNFLWLIREVDQLQLVFCGSIRKGMESHALIVFGPAVGSTVHDEIKTLDNREIQFNGATCVNIIIRIHQSQSLDDEVAGM